MAAAAFNALSLSFGRPYGKLIFHSSSCSRLGINVTGSCDCYVSTAPVTRPRRTEHQPLSNNSFFFCRCESLIHASGL